MNGSLTPLQNKGDVKLVYPNRLGVFGERKVWFPESAR
jgi:hypothetical protein